MPKVTKTKIQTQTKEVSEKGKGKLQVKPSAKVELSEAEKIKLLFRSLHDQIDTGFYSNAIKTCNKVLRLTPSDPLAIRTKLQLLLATDQYYEALTLVQETGGNDHISERIYCLYKSGRVVEAGAALDDLVEGVVSEDRALQVLEAQIRYRLEDYAKSRDLYDDLLLTADLESPEVPDLQTNLDTTIARVLFLSNVPSALASSTVAPLEKLEVTPVAHLIHSYPLYKTTASTAKAKAVKASVTTAVADPKNKEKLLDPDRWLPKRERPGFSEEIARKREQERGKKKQQLMTQGAAESTPAKASSGGGGTGSGGGGAKKKKGKK